MVVSLSQFADLPVLPVYVPVQDSPFLPSVHLSATHTLLLLLVSHFPAETNVRPGCCVADAMAYGGGMTYRHKRVQFNCYLYLYWLAFAIMGICFWGNSKELFCEKWSYLGFDMACFSPWTRQTTVKAFQGLLCGTTSKGLSWGDTWSLHNELIEKVYQGKHWKQGDEHSDNMRKGGSHMGENTVLRHWLKKKLGNFVVCVICC